MLFLKSNYQKNIEIYQKYYDSCTAINTRTINTTYATYKYNMMYFFEWLKDNGNYYLLSKKFIKQCIDIIEQYLSYCKRIRGNSNQTLHKKITAISSFYIWALKRGLVDRHPTSMILKRPTITQQDKVRKSYFLTTEQVKTIYKTMDTENWDIRDKVIFSLLFDTGMRINALYSLKLEQLNLEDCVFCNVNEKMGKIIDYVFFEKTKQYITEYLKFRSDSDNEYFLITKYRTVNHMSKETIRARVRKIGTIVGIYNLYPHTIRKTSVNLISKFAGIEIASEFANHQKTDTTKAHYIQPKTFKEKREGIRGAYEKMNIINSIN